MYPDETAFLDAVRTGDDTARLVFADWLDDHGQSAEAEYVRLGVELARCATSDPRREELLAREGC